MERKKEWGFIRETIKEAQKAGLDEDTGLCRTGLEEYLAVIFPEITDWIHNKEIPPINGIKRKFKPDYRSDSLKLIIEIDGLPHYKDPEIMANDREKDKVYISMGYSVIRIPYFIQLSKNAVKELFGIEINEELFDESYPSIGLKGRNTPAYLCPEGIKRMATEFLKFPNQMKVNIENLRKLNDMNENNHIFTGLQYLLDEIERIKS